MVKWYNESLPRISRGFDYPWPHKIKAPDGAFYDCGQGASELLRLRVIEKAFELNYEADAEITYPKGVLLP
jgi:hypothetical protein